MLAYTVNRLLRQRAVIQRDQATIDQWGAASTPNWQTIATVPALMWWWKESGRGPSREYAGPAETVAQQEGGMLLASGTSITEADRILQVLNQDGSLFADGTFDVITVFAPYQNYPPDTQGVVQIAWKRNLV